MVGQNLNVRGKIKDAPQSLYVSKSILKAQDEQECKVSPSNLVRPKTLLD